LQRGKSYLPFSKGVAEGRGIFKTTKRKLGVYVERVFCIIPQINMLSMLNF
jgi:hypothetical protein